MNSKRRVRLTDYDVAGLGREMTRLAKINYIQQLSNFGFNVLVTCHFPKTALLSPDGKTQCIRQTEAFYLRLNRAVFRSKRLRLPHFTVFEDKGRFGSVADFHMHALWKVEDCWKERVQDRFEREWNKAHEAAGLDCDWRNLDFAPGAIDYVLKHAHSEFEILGSLPNPQ